MVVVNENGELTQITVSVKRVDLQPPPTPEIAADKENRKPSKKKKK